MNCFYGGPPSVLPDGTLVQFARREYPGMWCIRVCPRQLDRDWANDAGFYFPPAPRDGANCRRMLAHLMSDWPVVICPVVGFLGDAPGHVSFEDGRHRFAALRDLDVDCVRIMVPRPDAAEFRRRYGPRRRRGGDGT
jgi:hypothetical protein